MRSGPDGATTVPTDVVGRRVAGWCLDALLVGGAAALSLVLLADSYERPGSDTSPDVARFGSDTAVFFRSTVAVVHAWEWLVTAAAAGVVALLVLVLLPFWRGWSPGLLAADLRIVDRAGGRPGIRALVLRTVGWLVDALPGIPVVGYLAMRFSRHHQRVGDRLGRCFVVHADCTGRDPTEPVDPGTTADAALEVTPLESTEPGDDPALEADDPTGDEVAGPPEGVTPDQPIWDREAREYTMWHGATGRWLVHDEDAGKWRPR